MIEVIVLMSMIIQTVTCTMMTTLTTIAWVMVTWKKLSLVMAVEVTVKAAAMVPTITTMMVMGMMVMMIMHGFEQGMRG